jgi:hypothetical protein
VCVCLFVCVCVCVYMHMQTRSTADLLGTLLKLRPRNGAAMMEETVQRKFVKLVDQLQPAHV